MATNSRYFHDMPVPYTPSPSDARAKSQVGFFGTAHETSGHQVIDANVHETRKRSRYGSTAHEAAIGGPWGEHVLHSTRASDTRSPPPLANDRYQLAGGMDGTHNETRRDGDYDDYFNLQKQRGTWSVPPTPQVGLARQAAVGEMHTTPSESKSWSIMSLVGGVAGKLFQFCTVPFRGFQAGGGTRYSIDAQEEVAAKLGLQDDPYQAGPVQQLPPAPSDDYGVQSIDSITPDRPRMAKRLRTADNWVVVGTNLETESRPSTPRLSGRRLPDRSPSLIPRPVSRPNAGTPSYKRPSLIPVSRRSTVDRRSFGGSPAATPGSHERARSYSRHSYGSPAMFDDKSSITASPLPKETQRLINNVRREEIEEDERLRRMSLQMTAMLREANEALGSKFEVEEYNDDDMDGNQGFNQQPTWFS